MVAALISVPKIHPAVSLTLGKTMIVKFTGPYGSAIDLNGSGEIQGYEFLDPPIEYRFMRAGSPISGWTSPERRYITLLHPVCTDGGVKTVGVDTKDVTIETRGLAGTFILLVWPR